jgi:hypothetical protein
MVTDLKMDFLVRNAGFMNELPFLDEVNIKTRDLFIDLLALSRAKTRRPKLTSSSFTASIIQIDYRVLELSRANLRKESGYLDDLLLLVMQCFTLSIFKQPCLRDQRFSLLQNQFQTVVEISRTDLTKYHDVSLWALFLGSMSLFTDSGNWWLLSKISECISSLQLRYWDDTLQTLVKFPWIEALHNHRGKTLWDACHQSSSKEN